MVIDFSERRKKIVERKIIEEKISLHVNKLIGHQEKESKLKNKKLCFFRKFRLKLLEASICEDKSVITEFVRLHSKLC